MEIPLYPLPASILFSLVPGMRGVLKKEKELGKQLPDWLETNQDWCRSAQQRLAAIQTTEQLVAFWEGELKPYYFDCALMIGASFRPYAKLVRKLRPKLIKLVGEADTNALLSSLSDQPSHGDGPDLMASLGPVVGVDRVARGQMSRQDYMDQYGHRGPHEMELAAPRPYEEPDWLDRRLAEHAHAPIDVDGLLSKRRADYEAAWQRFVERYPRKAKRMGERLQEVPPAVRLREAYRSEMVRAYGILRAFALRAGELTGLGDDVFFLNFDELMGVLNDGLNIADLSRELTARKETYERLCALPTPPSIIRGRFDPYLWAADPKRRNDIYDASAPVPVSDGTSLSGFAGAAGRVEGLVRRLDSFEEGDQLQPGEILVTAMTNVGWTPLFPRAAAVVTDVGAPLSHAAIVARELGIPAVVGCVVATTRLHTGDRIRVDGGQGIVEILGTAASEQS
jgi:pyruvate,water dikinase